MCGVLKGPPVQATSPRPTSSERIRIMFGFAAPDFSAATAEKVAHAKKKPRDKRQKNFIGCLCRRESGWCGYTCQGCVQYSVFSVQSRSKDGDFVDSIFKWDDFV